MSYAVPTSHHLHPGYGHELTRDWQTTNTKFDKSTFIYPIFVVDEDGQKNEIKSMPEQYQWSVDRLDELLEPLVKKGLKSVILFGVITKKERKDGNGSLEGVSKWWFLAAILFCFCHIASIFLMPAPKILPPARLA
jgi:delta-aminolevulinic acid dehydratase/porphobilinogen synthase